MPIHGLDHAMGLRETSLHTAGFIYGITGTTTALSGISYALIYDWPLNFGGKPHFALPAWIPITFELTVLFSAVGMVMTFCYLCQMAPFVRKHHFSLRATDDLFVMVIECMPKTNEADLQAFLKSIGCAGCACVRVLKRAGGLEPIARIFRRLIIQKLFWHNK